MKNIIMILSLLLAACSSGPGMDTKANHRHPVVLTLNEGRRWETDAATRKNVAALVRLVEDRRFTEASSMPQLVRELQLRVDTLVAECKMQGPAHEALHRWLEVVLGDLRALKKTDSDQQAVYAALKNDVRSFYHYFE